jgi:hypothetical protein
VRPDALPGSQTRSRFSRNLRRSREILIDPPNHLGKQVGLPAVPDRFGDDRFRHAGVALPLWPRMTPLGGKLVNDLRHAVWSDVNSFNSAMTLSTETIRFPVGKAKGRE